MSESNVKQIQAQCLSVFIRLREFLQDHDIEYFLVFGTLLGAVRHKGFIPWDDDLDIGMDRANYEKFLQVADQLPEPLAFEDAYTVKGCPVPKVRDKSSSLTDKNQGVGAFVDIFCFDYCTPVDAKIHRLRARCVGLRNQRRIYKEKSLLLYAIYSTLVWIPYSFYVAGRWVYRHLPKRTHGPLVGLAAEFPTNKFYKSQDLYPLKHMTFEGMDCLVPGNAHAMLTMDYGDYMTPVKYDTHF